MEDISVFLSSQQNRNLLIDGFKSYLPTKRWFSGKNSQIHSITPLHLSEVKMSDTTSWGLAILLVNLENGTQQTYSCPFTLSQNPPEHSNTSSQVIAKIEQQSSITYLIDSIANNQFCTALLSALQKGEQIQLPDGTLKLTATPILSSKKNILDLSIKRPKIDQTHNTIFLDEEFIFKLYRQIQSGLNPELQIGAYLSQNSNLACIARIAGSIEFLTLDSKRYTLAILQDYVANQGDSWNYVLSYLKNYINSLSDNHQKDLQKPHQDFLLLMQTLGERLGTIHQHLGAKTNDTDFNPELITNDYWDSLIGNILDSFYKAVEQASNKTASFSFSLQAKVKDLIDNKNIYIDKIKNTKLDNLGLYKTKHHGDLHLGQILINNNDFIIIDFEGEPGKPISESSKKQSPIRDIAGMVRSFSYAANMAYKNALAECSQPDLLPLLKTWESQTVEHFLKGYFKTTCNLVSIPSDKKIFNKILDLFCLEKALYEFDYELKNRPDWLEIPLSGIFSCLGNL